jgi:hypothetical protein
MPAPVAAPVVTQPMPEPPPSDMTPTADAASEVIELDGEVVFALDLADHGVEIQGWRVITITGVPGAPYRRVVISNQDGDHYSVSRAAWRDVPRSGRLTLEPASPEEAVQ